MPRKTTKTAKPTETTLKAPEVAQQANEVKAAAVAPTPVPAPAPAPAKAMAKAVEPVPNQPASDETRPNRAPSHEEISRRAYELWAKRGGVGGSAQEDWLRAEQELRARR